MKSNKLHSVHIHCKTTLSGSLSLTPMNEQHSHHSNTDSWRAEKCQHTSKSRKQTLTWYITCLVVNNIRPALQVNGIYIRLEPG